MNTIFTLLIVAISACKQGTCEDHILVFTQLPTLQACQMEGAQTVKALRRISSARLVFDCSTRGAS